MHDTELRKAAITLAHFLVPRTSILSQPYWDKHLTLIEHIGEIGAILGEHCYYFPRTRKRKVAWELVVATDLAWQTIRLLAGKTGSDQQWLAKALPDNHEHLFPPGTPLSYAPTVNLLGDIIWVFDLHSNLRHPGDTLPLMLSDPWPDEESCRLCRAAEGTQTILRRFNAYLEKGNGFLPDIEEKEALARQAKKNRAERS